MANKIHIPSSMVGHKLGTLGTPVKVGRHWGKRNRRKAKRDPRRIAKNN